MWTCMEGEKALKVEVHKAPVTFALVAINVVVFFALSFLEEQKMRLI